MNEETSKNGAGRPPTRTMPKRIPDTPENVARIIMKRPPKKKWRYLDKKGA